MYGEYPVTGTRQSASAQVVRCVHFCICYDFDMLYDSELSLKSRIDVLALPPPIQLIASVSKGSFPHLQA
jgi:hypothetical protein